MKKWVTNEKKCKEKALRRNSRDEKLKKKFT